MLVEVGVFLPVFDKVWDTSMLSIVMTAEQAEECLKKANLEITKTPTPWPENMPLIGKKTWETEYIKRDDGTYIKMRFMEMPKDAGCGRDKDFTTLLIGISKNDSSYI